MAETFLGTGWAFPIGVDSRGGIRTSADERKVKESIRIVLSTVPGERDMRPDFGCDLHAFPFEPNTDDLRGRIEFFVSRALAQWEPRVDTVAVSTTRSGAKIEADVRYRIRATNREDNVVIPFYLGEVL
jgi:hypothetical protein